MLFYETLFLKVARGHGTERPWTGLYNDNKDKGKDAWLKFILNEKPQEMAEFCSHHLFSLLPQ